MQPAASPTGIGLYSTVSQHDLLGFRTDHQLDYRKVADFLDFDGNALSKIAGISKASVRFDKKIPPVLRERLEQIANICSLVAEFFEGDAEKTALWFRTPNPMLGGIAPRDMIRANRYRRLLEFILHAREGDLGEW